MKVKYEHFYMPIPGHGGIEFDLKKIKRHWWTRWETVMDTTSCPMMFNIKNYDENGKKLHLTRNYRFDSVTVETSC